jgi:hypothetical protein
MTEKDDLRARLYEMHVGTDEHHATARQIRVMILDGDLAGAADALDALELDIHTALAAGAGPGGSGLPEQWTDGGHGDVTATTDDPNFVVFTVQGASGARAGAAELFTVNDDDDVPKFAVDALGGIGVHLVSTPFQGHFDIIEDGSGRPILNVGGASDPNGGSVNISRDGSVTVAPTTTDVPALRLAQVTAAPLDANLNPGEIAFWFDQTNGAAKLMIKAKQADGTVKTGQVALS